MNLNAEPEPLKAKTQSEELLDGTLRAELRLSGNPHCATCSVFCRLKVNQPMFTLFLIMKLNRFLKNVVCVALREASDLSKYPVTAKLGSRLR